MKKYFLSLLSLLAVISMCGCSSYIDKWANKVIDNMRDNDSGIASYSAISSISITKSSAVSSASIASSSAASSEEKTLSMAKWEGDVFVSEWAGFKVPLPSGWYKATAEEIKQVNKLSTEIITGVMEENIEKYKNPDTMYPMFILKNKLVLQTRKFNTNFLVLYEKLSFLNNIAIINADSYLDIVTAQLDRLKIGYVFQKTQHIQIAGETYSSVSATIAESNLKQMYISRRCDDYMISFIISGFLDNPGELEELVKSIEKN